MSGRARAHAALGLALGLVGCRGEVEQARIEGRDAEGQRVGALAAAFDRGDCPEVERLAAGFRPTTALRLAAASTWLGRCLYQGGRFADAERVLEPVAAQQAHDPFTRRALYQLGRAVYRQGRFDEAEATFVEFERRFARDTLADDAAYHRAKARLRADDLGGARALFEALLERPHVSRFREAGAHFQLGRIEASVATRAAPALDAAAAERAFARFALVERDFADTGFRDDAAYRAARLTYASGDFAQAEAALAQFEADYPDSSWREGARYYRGRSVEASGRADAAAALFASWSTDFPEGRYRDNAEYRLGQVRYGEAGRLTGLEADRAYDAAMTAFEAFLRAWPESSLRTSGQYFLGRALFERRRFAEARAQFTQVALDAESPYVDNALYYSGRADYEAASVAGPASLERAIASFDALLARFAVSPFADDAAYFRARALFRLMRNADADAAFTSFEEAYPSSPYVDNAIYHRLLLAAARGDCASAAALLASMRARFASSTLLPDAERVVLACAPTGG